MYEADMQGRVRSLAGAVVVVVSSLASSVTSSPAAADDEFMASAQLRGGYDANPMLLQEKKGSAFVGVGATFAVGRGDADNGYGLIGELERTDYADGSTAPYEQYRIELRGMLEHEGWSLRSSTRAEVSRNYSVQAYDAVQTIRARAPDAPLRAFGAVSVQYSTLNETNPLLGDFLPEPQRFVRATVSPGVSMRLGNATLGVSADISATKYTEETDLFGYRRDNERLEPFVFVAYADRGLDLYASVSRLHGRWHDVDFSDVNETLYEVSLTKEQGPFRISLAAQRNAQDTTFPVSPITIATRYGAELGYRITDDLDGRVFARGVRTAYLDSPFSTDTQAIGVGLSYALPGDMMIGADVARISGTAMDGSAIEGGVATLSLKKKIAGAARREGEPPPALATNPSWDPRPVQSRHQP